MGNEDPCRGGTVMTLFKAFRARFALVCRVYCLPLDVLRTYEYYQTVLLCRGLRPILQ